MKSTLLIGDFLYVNKFAYGYSYASCPRIMGVEFCGFAQGSNKRIWGEEPERGDVIVFRHPTNGSDFVKRLIGLPGDTIRVANGVVFINGQEAVQVPDGLFAETYGPQGPESSFPRCANGPQGEGGICEKERFIETLPGGVGHLILNINDRESLDNTQEFTVPEGQYFFMGDNRDCSKDSRFLSSVGYVHKDNLVGKAQFLFFSNDSEIGNLFTPWFWHKSIRFERLFKKLN